MAKNAAPAPTLAELQPHSAINISLSVISQNTLPQVLPPLIVPPGLSVLICGYVGGSVNNAIVYVTLNRKSLETASTGLIVIPPSNSPKDGVTLTVDNLSQIWWKAEDQGDGLTVTINGTSLS